MQREAWPALGEEWAESSPLVWTFPRLAREQPKAAYTTLCSQSAEKQSGCPSRQSRHVARAIVPEAA